MGPDARQRAQVLHRVADLIRERADEIVATESLYVGKPVALCRAVDLETVAQQYADDHGGRRQCGADATEDLRLAAPHRQSGVAPHGAPVDGPRTPAVVSRVRSVRDVAHGARDVGEREYRGAIGRCTVAERKERL